MINIEEIPIISNKAEIIGSTDRFIYWKPKGIKSRIDSFLTIFPPIEATVIVIVKANN